MNEDSIYLGFQRDEIVSCEDMWKAACLVHVGAYLEHLEK